MGSAGFPEQPVGACSASRIASPSWPLCTSAYSQDNLAAIGAIFYVLPWMGLELLETARAVAEFDLPMRVLGLWWGNP